MFICSSPTGFGRRRSSFIEFKIQQNSSSSVYCTFNNLLLLCLYSLCQLFAIFLFVLEIQTSGLQQVQWNQLWCSYLLLSFLFFVRCRGIAHIIWFYLFCFSRNLVRLVCRAFRLAFNLIFTSIDFSGS